MGEWNLVESRKETRVRLALDCGAWTVFTAREFV
jgi:hypothetical protein